MLVAPDSIHFVDDDNDSLTSVRTQDVRSFEIVHRGGGAIEGLMFRGLGGLAVGLATGTGWGSSVHDNMGRGLLALSTTVLGGVGGLVVGAIKGHGYTFLMPIDSAKTAIDTMVPPYSDQ